MNVVDFSAVLKAVRLKGRLETLWRSPGGQSLFKLGIVRMSQIQENTSVVWVFDRLESMVSATLSILIEVAAEKCKTKMLGL